MRRFFAATAFALLSVACESGSSANKVPGGQSGSSGSSAAPSGAAAPDAQTGSAVAASPAAGAPTVPGCGADGEWAACAALKRLDMAGMVVTRDSAAAHEKGLTVSGLLLHVARGDLELFFYPDSAARAHDEGRLDRAMYIEFADEPTFKNEWTIIRAQNMLGLLRVPSAAQRERVWNALMSGPPRAPEP